MKLHLKKTLEQAGYAEYKYRWYVLVIRPMNHYPETILSRSVVEDDGRAEKLFTLLSELNLSWNTVEPHPMVAVEAVADIDALVVGQIAAII